MTDTHTAAPQNKAVVQTVYDSVASMNIDRFLQCCADDIVLVEAASLAVAGTYVGRDEVLGCIGRLASAFDWSTLTVKAMVSEGNLVVSQASVEASGPNRMVIEICEWWTLRDGKVVECRPYYLDTETVNRVLRENAAAQADSDH